MIEKTITRTIEKVETVYVADDGTEFKSKIECLNHETDCLFAAAEETVKGMPHFIHDEPCGDETFCWAYARTKKEAQDFILYCLNNEELEYYRFDDEGSYPELFKVPLWLVGIYDGDGYGGVYSAESMLGYYEKFVSEVREKIRDEMNNMDMEGKESE